MIMAVPAGTIEALPDIWIKTCRASERDHKRSVGFKYRLKSPAGEWRG
jgi:hypothetical protein